MTRRVRSTDSSGLRDADHESDAIANFFLGTHIQLEASAHGVAPLPSLMNYESSPYDYPTASTSHHASNYGGGQASFTANLPKNNFQAGFYGFGQADHSEMGVLFNCPTNGDPIFPTAAGRPFRGFIIPIGSVAAFFLDDKFKPFSWLTRRRACAPLAFPGACRHRHHPRFPASRFNVPRLNWTSGAFTLLLPSAAAHRLRPASRVCQQQRSDIHSAARRARRNSYWRSSSGTAGFSTPTPSAPMPPIFLDHNNVGESNLFSAYDSERGYPRSSDPAVSTYRKPRTNSPGLFQPGCLGWIVSPTADSPIFLISRGDRSITTSATRSTLEDATCRGALYASIYYGSGFHERVSRRVLSGRLPAYATRST